jgi:Na+/H+ antiporter NhaC
MQKINTAKGVLALSPIIVLLTIYLAGSIVAGDFYKIPIAVAFMAASVYAIAITRGRSLNERIDSFSQGAANTRIMYMVWIFVLAGAFAALAKAMGAVDATVNLTLNLIPSNYLPAGIFIAACFVSMSIGTSVGTIVALTPVVTALAAQMNCDVAWLVAIVVGGSFFGDNLSFISDTTIAATQTQGCSMRSKFKTNIVLVMPAAVVTLLLYAFSGNSIEEITTVATTWSEGIKCIPYITVIVCALLGMNVLAVLITGIVIAAGMGIAYGEVDGISVFTEMGSGIMGMCELIIVTMLAGGLLEIVRINGGLDYMIRIITLRVR